MQLTTHQSSTFWKLSTVIAFALTVCIYWPGLSGGFVLDDFSFIVWNTDLHVRGAAWGDWARAALSFPADHQGRWLSMLTFSANYYFGGLNPFGYKLVNLVIHLINGVLVYAVVSALLRLWSHQRPHQAPDSTRQRWLALAVAALWLVLPINLTAVLYVSQRLESLSHLFVLAGLTWYLRVRTQLPTSGSLRLLVALLVPTSLGLLAKESAVLLPLYAACVEAVFFRDTASQPFRRRIGCVYIILLALPLIAGLVWLTSWLNTEQSYARPFSTAERLMTEARVMFHYMQWSLLPLPNDLTLYHDDLALSAGLLSPPQTLASIIGIAALGMLTIWQARKRPMVSIGIAWFFAGHVLTGTIIPLELVFEHRNYFPSIGLLLAVVTFAGASNHRQFSWRALSAAFAVIFCFYAFSTTIRSIEWSSPTRLGLSEAKKRPDSPRAQYEFAYTYLLAAGYNASSPLRQQAHQALEHCRILPRSDTQCEAALILDANKMGVMPDQAWWASLTQKLVDRTPNVSDYSAAATLFQCQLTAGCYYQPAELQAALDAALSHPAPGSLWMDLAAQFQAFLLQKPDIAIPMFKEVIRLQPNNPSPRGNLIRVQIMFGDLKGAEYELTELSKLNHLGSRKGLIDRLTQELAQARKKQAAKGPVPQ